jgi:putative membrane protein
MGLLIRLLLNAVALLVVAYLVPGIHVHGFGGALIAALILGIVNAVLRPILIVVSLPLEIVTLGLFTLVINALLFWLVGALHVGLDVDGFRPAFIGAIVMAIVSWILSLLTRGMEPNRARV